ncbi:MAG: hypothetical protein H0U76_19050 [Ktedonobacteraceae bacterium]|nr:hypothetical protein [Ktedonobacteraceae bacterium]
MRETKQTERTKEISIVKSGVFPTLVALILVLLACSYLIVRHWPHPTSSAATGSAQPLQGPGGSEFASLHLPVGYSVLYEQAQGISLLSTTNGVPHRLETPGYRYNRAVTPLVTPAHELIYSGDGVWITNLSSGHPRRLAMLPRDQVITSLALSSDSTTVAWSSAPRAGDGTIAIYSEPLTSPDRVVQVYQHSAAQCPCFRIFSFLSSHSLLLTNDRGDHRQAQYGLWRFDLPENIGSSVVPPQPLLPSDVQQGPLLFSPQTSTLLYSSYEGFVPMPDSGVPTDITSLNYANSLLVASIDQGKSDLERQRVLLPEQETVSGPAAYRWVATPQFSLDGQTLAYAEFSSGDRLPFARHYALYSASLESASEGSPRLVATANAQYVELGPWLTAHIVTFYADNALYALDMQSGALTTLIQTGSYAHIISVVK